MVSQNEQNERKHRVTKLICDRPPWPRGMIADWEAGDPGSNPSRVRWDFLSRSAPTQSRPAEGLMGRLLPHSRDLSTSRIRLLVCFLRMTHCATCLSTTQNSDTLWVISSWHSRCLYDPGPWEIKDNYDRKRGLQPCHVVHHHMETPQHHLLSSPSSLSSNKIENAV